MRILNSRARRPACSTQRGGMLVEVAVAIFLFGLVGTMVLSGISTNALTGRQLETQATVENLGRNQMEYVLGQAYQDPPASCPIDPGLTIPNGYSINCEVAEYETGNLDIAQITVAVEYNGAEWVSLETVRAR